MPAKSPRLAVVIDDNVKKQIQRLAVQHRRSTSAEIVYAIERWLETNASEMEAFNEAS